MQYELVLDDIGVYYETVLEAIEISNTSLEVRSILIIPSPTKPAIYIMFHNNITQLTNGTGYDLVCSLFRVYSHVQVMLDTLPEDDERQHNVSVLAFVTEKQTEAVCHRVSRPACGKCVEINV